MWYDKLHYSCWEIRVEFVFISDICWDSVLDGSWGYSKLRRIQWEGTHTHKEICWRSILKAIYIFFYSCFTIIYLLMSYVGRYMVSRYNCYWNGKRGASSGRHPSNEGSIHDTKRKSSTGLHKQVLSYIYVWCLYTIFFHVSNS